jgi:ATP synthase F0 subunit b
LNINLTLIGQMLAFVAFVVFCMKYVWPPILAAMQERERKIAEGLAAADQASQDLELAKEKAVERLKEAKEEAAGIIEAANRAPARSSKKPRTRPVEAERIKARRRPRSSRKATGRANSCAARSPAVAGRRRESAGCVHRRAGACRDARQTRRRAVGRSHGRTEHTGTPLRQGRL